MLFKAKNKILYKDWIWDWLSYKKDYIKESTYANYSNIISNHIAPDLGKYYLKEINNKIIQEFLLNKYKSGRLDKLGGLSNKTIRDIVAIIKSSLKSAMKEELIQNLNLDFIYPKTNTKDKIYTISKQNQDKLTNYILKNQSSKNLGILLTLYSGIRIGELCALQWKDIDLDNKTIHVNKTMERIYIPDNIGTARKKTKVEIGSPKTTSSDRYIPILKDILPVVKRFSAICNPDYYVCTCDEKFIEPRSLRVYYKTFILDKVKLDHCIKFHGLRHTFASTLIENKVDIKTVSTILGHSDISTTLNVYVHPSDEAKRDAVNVGLKRIFK